MPWRLNCISLSAVTMGGRPSSSYSEDSRRSFGSQVFSNISTEPFFSILFIGQNIWSSLSHSWLLRYEVHSHRFFFPEILYVHCDEFFCMRHQGVFRSGDLVSISFLRYNVSLQQQLAQIVSLDTWYLLAVIFNQNHLGYQRTHRELMQVSAYICLHCAITTECWLKKSLISNCKIRKIRLFKTVVVASIYHFSLRNLLHN